MIGPREVSSAKLVLRLLDMDEIIFLTLSSLAGGQDISPTKYRELCFKIKASKGTISIAAHCLMISSEYLFSYFLIRIHINHLIIHYKEKNFFRRHYK